MYTEQRLVMNETNAVFYQSFYVYQLMHKRIALKRILKFTLKQLLHVSV